LGVTDCDGDVFNRLVVIERVVDRAFGAVEEVERGGVKGKGAVDMGSRMMWRGGAGMSEMLS